MSSRKHIVTGSLVTAGLIALGLLLGIWAQSHFKTSYAPSDTPPPEKPNAQIYEASPPSKGRINFTLPIPLKPTGSLNYLMLPKDRAEHVEKDQYALLYDKDDYLLPIIGKVIEVMPGTGQHENTVGIRLEINDMPDTPLADVALADILIGHLKYAQRLPLTALVRHNDESAHVWEVIREEGDTRTAKLRTLSEEPMIFGNFFVLEEGEYISNTYILNPDEALKDGQTIRVSDVLYEAPFIPNPEWIVDDMAMQKLMMPERIIITDDTACASTASSACGSGGGVTNYIERIKQMAREEAEKAKGATTP